MLWAMALALGSAAVFEDLRRRSISNWINGSALLAAVLYQAFRGGIPGLVLSMAGAFAGLAAFAIPFWLGAMGGGDLKLMAAFGSMLGPSSILLAALLASMIGGLMAGATLVWHRSRPTIPYAPAIVAGAWLTLLSKS